MNNKLYNWQLKNIINSETQELQRKGASVTDQTKFDAFTQRMAKQGFWSFIILGIFIVYAVIRIFV